MKYRMAPNFCDKKILHKTHYLKKLNFWDEIFVI